MKDSSVNTELYIDLMKFCTYLLDDLKNGKKFCFLIGSGASVSSGIPCGRKMVQEWFLDLKKNKDTDSFRADIVKRINKVIENHPEECADDLRYELNKYSDINYVPNITESQKDYNYIYELRFVWDENEGKRYFLTQSDNAYPNIGYISLASILCNCNDGNLVITTNFDELIELASFIYQRKKTINIDHDLLAEYAFDNWNGRPKILKIHQGVSIGGFNKARETYKLKDNWKMVLTSLFNEYIPIVVGYSGTDNDLMDFFDAIKLQGMYWCNQYGSKPCKRVKNLVKKQNGKFVSIYDSDQLFMSIEPIFVKREIVHSDHLYDPSRQAFFQYKHYVKAMRTIRKSMRCFEEKSLERLMSILKKRDIPMKFGKSIMFGVALMLEDSKTMRKILDGEMQGGRFYDRGYLELGKTYRRKGDIKSEISMYEKILKNEECGYYFKANSLKNMCDIYKKTDRKKFIDTLSKVIEIEPFNEACINEFSRCKESKGYGTS